MVLKKSMHPVIEKLFEGLFSDLDKEVSEKEAGWISLDQLGINLTIKKELLKLNVIEEDSKGNICFKNRGKKCNRRGSHAYKYGLKIS